MIKLITSISFFIFTGSTVMAASGEQVAQTCTACHGVKGISTNLLWPNLAGQKKAYIESQLKAYKSKQMYNSLMTPVAQMLSGDEIKNVASYLSKLERSP